MLTTITRALALIQIILNVAAAADPASAKFAQYVAPAVQKANAILVALAGFTTPANATAALDELAQALTVLQQQGLIPANASGIGKIETLILTSDAALHNYVGGQAVPVAPISVEGKPGELYAIPNAATAEINAALGR